METDNAAGDVVTDYNNGIQPERLRGTLPTGESMLPRPRSHSRGLLEPDDVLCGCSRCEGDPSISSSSVGQPEVARRRVIKCSTLSP